MDNDGSTLERLRRKLADLESAQRATGGTVCAEFWKAPSPDAAGPAPSDTAGQGWPGSDRPSDSRGGTSTRARSAADGDRAGGFAAPLRVDWSSWSGVAGALAPTLAFAVGITALPDLEPTSLDEADLFESVAQLGHLQHHREVVLVRLVGDIEARGLACPGGLGRVDWLRSLDPSLTVTAAKAVVTCAAAFNEPRWQSLRDAVTGRRTVTSGGTGGCDTAAAESAAADANTAAPSVETGPAGAASRVTVGKAAQVIDFHTRLKPVADPDDLEQAVTHLTEQAAELRPEVLAR